MILSKQDRFGTTSIENVAERPFPPPYRYVHDPNSFETRVGTSHRNREILLQLGKFKVRRMFGNHVSVRLTDDRDRAATIQKQREGNPRRGNFSPQNVLLRKTKFGNLQIWGMAGIPQIGPCEASEDEVGRAGVGRRCSIISNRVVRDNNESLSDFKMTLDSVGVSEVET